MSLRSIAAFGLSMALAGPVFGSTVDFYQDKIDDGPSVGIINDNLKRLDQKIDQIAVAASSPSVTGDLNVDSITATTGTFTSLTATTIMGNVLLVPYPFMQVRDDRAQGTDGGGFSAGGQVTRTLQTVATNTITGASLATSSVTLPSGTYYFEWKAQAFRVDGHQSRLRKVSGTAENIGLGITAYSSNAGNDGMTSSDGSSVYTSTGTFIIILQHRCENTVGTSGRGDAANFDTETYAWINIWKIK